MLSLSVDIDEFSPPRPHTQVKARHRNRMVKTPRSGAPRIYIEYAVLLNLLWGVGVSTYHNLKSPRHRIYV